jgi:hypothetical protein
MIAVLAGTINMTGVLVSVWMEFRPAEMPKQAQEKKWN